MVIYIYIYNILLFINYAEYVIAHIYVKWEIIFTINRIIKNFKKNGFILLKEFVTLTWK